MPRPRIPTATLALRGAFKRNPNRLTERRNEPLVKTPLPGSPSYLAADVSKVWDEMRERGYWLTSADRYLVEIAATLTAQYRHDQLNHGATSVLIALLSKLGFSPKERGALNLPTRTT